MNILESSANVRKPSRFHFANLVWLFVSIHNEKMEAKTCQGCVSSKEICLQNRYQLPRLEGYGCCISQFFRQCHHGLTRWSGSRKR
jgi:hypothetical protein